MRMRFGAEPKSTPPRLVTPYVSTLRGKPSGSHVMNGSFDAPGAASWLLPRFVAVVYAFRCLTIAWPAGVIGGAGSGLLLVPGPTHAPDRSRFGAGPGGFGIFGMPSEMNPSPVLRCRPCAAGPAACATSSDSTAASEARIELRTVSSSLLLRRGVGIVSALAALVAAKLRVVQLTSIREDDLLQPAGRVAVLRQVHSHRDLVARRDRRLRPADQPQRLRGRGFNGYMHGVAFGVFRVEVDERVRIGPVELRHRGVFELGDLVVISRVAMVRQHTAADTHQNAEAQRQRHEQLAFHNRPRHRRICPVHCACSGHTGRLAVSHEITRHAGGAIVVSRGGSDSSSGSTE